MGRLTEAVKHLLIINVILFFATNLYGEQMYQWLSLWFPKNDNFQWWQVISHMFMHGGLMHIVFNMYALWAFGTPLERVWGRNKFLFFYFSAGLGSALLHTGVNYYYIQEAYNGISGFISKEVFYEILNVDSQIGNQFVGQKFFENASKVLTTKGIDPSFLTLDFESVFEAHTSLKIPAVGASGAIYGILVAFAFMYSEAKLMLIFLPIPIKAKYFVPLLIAVDLIFGIGNVNTGVAHFAHIGGALIGFIMMWYWKRNQFNNNRWD
ncbi:rhomboid family intramembrane serine protease [Flagellimonas nanhaiensis]|uniref:Rhomboid family intramembrane serine protease n=1 Tax=Flagellimonas nanhaiensis TaxID=2292706 RepID=A0A371JTH1_9FLAO|nr:rhomboid family intramembrane serine protease [Allomuricauda nanhaiensis]RDY61076.1 rhomboid family intramembrane serine protease [Allomuricauda nanhaiensis]